MGDTDAGLGTGGAAAMELAVEAALERGSRIVPCGNCAAPVLGKYCGECGQAMDTHRRSVFHLLHDLLTDIASFDSRVLRTIRALFLQPGELPVAFREGRTQRYVPPIRLYLFVSLIFFLFLSVTNIAIFQLEARRQPPTTPIPASLPHRTNRRARNGDRQPGLEAALLHPCDDGKARVAGGCETGPRSRQGQAGQGRQSGQ